MCSSHVGPPRRSLRSPPVPAETLEQRCTPASDSSGECSLLSCRRELRAQRACVGPCRGLGQGARAVRGLRPALKQAMAHSLAAAASPAKTALKNETRKVLVAANGFVVLRWQRHVSCVARRTRRRRSTGLAGRATSHPANSLANTALEAGTSHLGRSRAPPPAAAGRQPAAGPPCRCRPRHRRGPPRQRSGVRAGCSAEGAAGPAAGTAAARCYAFGHSGGGGGG